MKFEWKENKGNWFKVRKIRGVQIRLLKVGNCYQRAGTAWTACTRHTSMSTLCVEKPLGLQVCTRIGEHVFGHTCVHAHTFITYGLWLSACCLMQQRSPHMRVDFFAHVCVHTYAKEWSRAQYVL